MDGWKTFLFSIFLYGLSLNVESSDKTCRSKNFQENLNVYLLNNSLSTVESIGFQQCIDLCFKRSNCDSVNFYKTRLKCEMNTDIGNTARETLLQPKVGYVHIVVNRSSTETEDQIECKNKNCPKDTRCVKLKSNTTVCLPEPCARSDYILASDLQLCFKIHDTLTTYQSAVATCASENTSLLIIDSAAKLTYMDEEHLHSKFPAHIGFFIGGQKNGGHWQLPDGTILDQSVGWSQVAMNNDGPCLVFWRAGTSPNYIFADANCYTDYRFICGET